MSSAPPSASLRNLFSELEQLFQTETEARVSTSVQAAVRDLTEHLNQSVRRLRQAESFVDVAGILCDASVPFSQACAVFEVMEGMIGGVRMRGASAETGTQFEALRFPASSAPSFAGLIESREPMVALGSPSEVSAEVAELFGHAAGDKVYLFPLAIHQRVAGILYVCGSVQSAALELLGEVASTILEARQPVRAVEASKPPDELVRIAPMAAPASPERDWDSMSEAERKLHLRAQRFARVQVAEMRLYKPDAVQAGRARSDLYSELQDGIDAGRKAYRETFLKGSSIMVDYFHRELVRTLANENPALLGEKYPGPLV